MGSRPKRKLPAAGLLRELAEQLRGSVEVGAEWQGEIVADDLVAEVTVKVRRRVSSDAERAFREQALGALRKDTFRVRHCECYVTRRGWRSYQAPCSGRVVASVVTGGLAASESFRFVCSRHRDAHGVDPRYVLGTVSLSERELRPIREQSEKDRIAWEAKCRQEEELRLRRKEGAPR